MTSVAQIAVASGIVAEQSECSIGAAIVILGIRAKTTGHTIVATAAAVIDRHEVEVR